jgi:hypothetical protein
MENTKYKNNLVSSFMLGIYPSYLKINLILDENETIKLNLTGGEGHPSN